MKYLYKISSIVATLALIAGLSFSTSFAQTTNKQKTKNAKKYTLSGTVVNAQGQAVANAKVMVLKANSMGQAMTATTNDMGQFTIEKISSGTYTVKVKADSYKTWKKTVMINSDKTLNITLGSAQK